jgi:hypothetical protein
MAAHAVSNTLTHNFGVGRSRNAVGTAPDVSPLSRNFSEEEPMRQFLYALALGLIFLPALTTGAKAITEDEAHASLNGQFD